MAHRFFCPTVLKNLYENFLVHCAKQDSGWYICFYLYMVTALYSFYTNVEKTGGNFANIGNLLNKEKIIPFDKFTKCLQNVNIKCRN